MSQLKETTITLASDPQSVAKVEPFVALLFKQFSIDPTHFGNILISLTEAVTNAINHGNQRDQSKLVTIKSNITSTQISLVVSDQGPGFDYENLPDPTTEENICNIGGRGVFLISQLSDDVDFHDDGRTIEIKFNL